MNSTRVSSGSALLELLVALTISGFVLLSARALMDNLADASQGTLEMMSIREDSINAEQHVRALLGRVVSASVRHGSVSGNKQSLRAVTWCEVPAGWLEECVIALEFRSVNERSALVLASPIDTAVIRYGDEPGGFRYFEGTAGWLTSWTSTVTTPLGILAIIDSDTLVLRIGERG